MCQLVTTNSIRFDENLKESTLLSWNLACGNVQEWASHFSLKQQDLKKVDAFKSKPVCGELCRSPIMGGSSAVPMGTGRWVASQGIQKVYSLNCWSALTCPESFIPCLLLCCQLSMYGNMTMQRRKHSRAQKGTWRCTEGTWPFTDGNMAMHRRKHSAQERTWPCTEEKGNPKKIDQNS